MKTRRAASFVLIVWYLMQPPLPHLNPHHGRLDPGVELIMKPFTYADPAAKVRRVLDA
jgi:hypothetical protein